MTEILYPGEELALFSRAHHWRRYWTGEVEEFISGRTLEVGAGLGSVTPILEKCSSEVVAIEPDPHLRDALTEHVQKRCLGRVTVLGGTLQDLPQTRDFDTIIYADVLEHIEDDRGELTTASRLLRDRGTLIVLVPAHQWLYSPFDAQVGHFRRYSRRVLRDLTPPHMRLVRLRSLDFVGLAASGANRLALKSANPSQGQVEFWDRYLVRASRLLDPLLRFRFGKSLLAIWKSYEL